MFGKGSLTCFKWNVESLGNDEYILSNYDDNGRLCPIVSVDDSLFVSTPYSDRDASLKWFIRPNGSGLYRYITHLPTFVD